MPYILPYVSIDTKGERGNKKRSTSKFESQKVEQNFKIRQHFPRYESNIRDKI